MSSIELPEKCRQRLMHEGKPYPRGGCEECGKFSPKSKQCDALISAAKDGDALLELLIDAAAYGAFNHELSARDSSMGEAVGAQEYIKQSKSVRRQMTQWLQDYRAQAEGSSHE